jgi:hypothetical protein
MDTEEMVRLIVREGGEDLARYLRGIHRELAGLREEAHKLRLVNEETKHELSRLNHFRRRILDAVDEDQDHNAVYARQRLKKPHLPKSQGEVV